MGVARIGCDVSCPPRHSAGAAGDTLTRTARAFSKFASGNPALYDAMFSRATRLRFATDDTPAPLHAAFRELRAAVATVAHEPDIDTLTEVLWAGLHGLATLSRSGRLRPGHEDERIELLVAQFAVTGSRQALDTTAMAAHVGEQESAAESAS